MADIHNLSYVDGEGRPYGMVQVWLREREVDGEAEAALPSVDDRDGLEVTLEILAATDSVARICENLGALARGEPGSTSRPSVPT